MSFSDSQGDWLLHSSFLSATRARAQQENGDGHTPTCSHTEYTAHAHTSAKGSTDQKRGCEGDRDTGLSSGQSVHRNAGRAMRLFQGDLPPGLRPPAFICRQGSTGLQSYAP